MPQWSDRFEFLFAGGYRRRSHQRQACVNRRSVFRADPILIPPILPFSIGLWSTLQQCRPKHYRVMQYDVGAVNDFNFSLQWF